MGSRSSLVGIFAKRFYGVPKCKDNTPSLVLLEFPKTYVSWVEALLWFDKELRFLIKFDRNVFLLLNWLRIKIRLHGFVCSSGTAEEQFSKRGCLKANCCRTMLRECPEVLQSEFVESVIAILINVCTYCCSIISECTNWTYRRGLVSRKMKLIDSEINGLITALGGKTVTGFRFQTVYIIPC